MLLFSRPYDINSTHSDPARTYCIYGINMLALKNKGNVK